MNGITAAKRGFVLGLAGPTLFGALYSALVGTGPICCGSRPDPATASVLGAVVYGVNIGLPVGALGAMIGAIVFCKTDDPELDLKPKSDPHPLDD